MSQDPPLPYTGAITLKNLLSSPLFLNDPLQNKAKTKKKDDEDSIISHSAAVVGNSLWDSSNLIQYNDVNDFKLELLGTEDFWSELNTLDDMRSVEEYLQIESLKETGESDSPEPIHRPGSCTGSPTLANALLMSPTSSPTSSAPSSPRESTDIFQEKYSPEALVLASVPGEGLFNPCKRKFNREELKPQPVMKKSQKMFVPEDLKDDRYWTRRQRNNTAARRSRDAKRIKENQIGLRAAFLEDENEYLREELAKTRTDNKGLRTRLQKYEPV